MAQTFDLKLFGNYIIFYYLTICNHKINFLTAPMPRNDAYQVWGAELTQYCIKYIYIIIITACHLESWNILCKPRVGISHTDFQKSLVKSLPICLYVDVFSNLLHHVLNIWWWTILYYWNNTFQTLYIYNT